MEPFVPSVAEPPRQRLTAGVLLRREDGRVLLVEPTYRPDWLTPGGSVEATESPAEAAAREVSEELGLALPVGRLLAMHWRCEPGDTEGVLEFAYDGGVVDAATVGRFRLEAGLASFRFVERGAVARLASCATAARVEAAFTALAAGTVVELGR